LRTLIPNQVLSGAGKRTAPKPDPRVRWFVQPSASTREAAGNRGSPTNFYRPAAPAWPNMAASLTKIVSGKLIVSDTLTNEQTVRCPRCDETYRLGYSDGEWHRVKDWLKLAETAIRKDHDLRHEAATIPLEWRGLRRR
jgi:hypothetical protein